MSVMIWCLSSAALELARDSGAGDSVQTSSWTSGSRNSATRFASTSTSIRSAWIRTRMRIMRRNAETASADGSGRLVVPTPQEILRGLFELLLEGRPKPALGHRLQKGERISDESPYAPDDQIFQIGPRNALTIAYGFVGRSDHQTAGHVVAISRSLLHRMGRGHRLPFGASSTIATCSSRELKSCSRPASLETRV